VCKKTNGKSILYDTLKKTINATKLFTRLWAASALPKGVSRKISRGGQRKKDRKIALLSLFRGGEQQKKDRKIAKKYQK